MPSGILFVVVVLAIMGRATLAKRKKAPPLKTKKKMKKATAEPLGSNDAMEIIGRARGGNLNPAASAEKDDGWSLPVLRKKTLRQKKMKMKREARMAAAASGSPMGATSPKRSPKRSPKLSPSVGPADTAKLGSSHEEVVSKLRSMLRNKKAADAKKAGIIGVKKSSALLKPGKNKLGSSAGAGSSSSSSLEALQQRIVERATATGGTVMPPSALLAQKPGAAAAAAKAAKAVAGGGKLGRKARKKAKAAWVAANKAFGEKVVLSPPPTKSVAEMAKFAPPDALSKGERMERQIDEAIDHAERMAEVAQGKGNLERTKPGKLSVESQFVLRAHQSREPTQLPDFLFAHLKK